ncbi:SDR family NAD(P)-dependent oxidoreductase [Streptomyces sp. NPDC094448]|uniref:SDR family NAD(P)-dependent oxidoreductase n=1 Tax=Streptomyces sp. NPDC094448 TaxID=3366063 RepID=UPI003808E390
MEPQLERLLLDLKARRVSKEHVKEFLRNRDRRADGDRRDETGPAPELVRARPVWHRADGPATAREPGHTVLLIDPPAGVERELRASTPPAAVHLLESASTGPAERYAELAERLLAFLRMLLADRALPRTLVQLVCSGRGGETSSAGLLAMARSAALENHALLPQLVLIDPETPPAAAAAQILTARDHPGERAVRFRDGVREARTWEELPEPGPVAPPWREGGTYVVTGGLGGLGLVFARDLLSSVRNVTLLLTGRSPLGNRSRLLEELRRPHARVEYTRLDVADEAAVEAFFAAVRREHGPVHGVVHSAGVLRDGFLRGKSAGELREVLAPKVAGTLHLDAATRDEPLDFLALFSSAAAVTGNAGQADYAAANAFMDAFAHHRALLVAEGRRSGRSLSLNWPLWAEGGMPVDEETRRALWEEAGMLPLRTERGLRTFHEALASSHCQVMAVEGDGPRVRRTFLGAPPAAPAPDAPAAVTALAVAESADTHAGIDEEALHDKVLGRLKHLFSGVIGLSVGKIDAETPLEAYGVDSIVVTRLNRKLAGTFTGLSASLLYEFTTLDALTGHFLREHRGACLHWTGAARRRSAGLAGSPAAPANAPATPSPAGAPATAPQPRRASGRPDHGTTDAGDSAAPFLASSHRPTGAAPRADDGAVAVIGMSGRFPQARDLREFWENLAGGRDCVTEIPVDRWPLAGFYHPDRDEAVAARLSYSKWGGFVDGFADFDPLFFGISPQEAMNTDPQERLFLQESWNALENAGYTRRRVAEAHRGRVGVFAGVSKTGFDLYGPQLWERNERLHPLTSFSSVANRVSYLLDLHGPSLPVDTMCSSSLSAVHEAMEHLRRDECELALAGGVNLYLHPSNYLLMSGKRMLSDDGRCRSFGAGGNGFVPGEGVAVVLLKRLADAERDGDLIHAVLRGSGVNHGGRTHGYTVPNPVAQAEVVRRALDRAGVAAGEVGYLETHGTGTSLGDPVEIEGLTQAFARDTDARQYCAVGSAKSAIGHLEAAAGIAGLIKVILQMQHGRFVPSLHADEPNPDIDFARTPFRLQREAADWPRPTRPGPGGEPEERHRIAGVSSFGAGGSNAHVVVEEYHRPATTPVPVAPAADGPWLFVLSAKDSDRLRERARDLVDWLHRRDPGHLDLGAVAHTLQSGREAMETRLALCAATVAELAGKLAAFAAGENEVEGLHRGAIGDHRDTLAALGTDSDMASTVATWIDKRKDDKLLGLWVKGLAVDWSRLHTAGRPAVVPLPGYPFARDRHWVGDLLADAPASPGTAAGERLHPLVHTNTSTLEAQRFDTVLTGREPFLTDHVVAGRRVLPGVAHLEMARAALVASLDEAPPATELRHVVWARPLVVTDGPVRVRTTLYAADPEETGPADASVPGGGVAFEIATPAQDPAAGALVHSRGAVLPLTDARTPEPLDLTALRAACGSAYLDAEACYRFYRALGLEYGLSHRGVESVAVGEGQALARLRLPDGAEAAALDAQPLHPGLLDAALQSSIGLFRPDGENPEPEDGALHLPFAVDRVTVLGPCAPRMWAWVRYSADDRPESGVRRIDIDVLDDDGVPRVLLRGFTSRAHEAPAASASVSGAPAPVRETPAAGPRAARPQAPLVERTRRYLVDLLAGELRLPPDRIDADSALEHYGIDSIMTMNLTSRLEQVFGSLPKTLFFEYQSIGELAGYFLAGHRERLTALLPGDTTPSPSADGGDPGAGTGTDDAARRPGGPGPLRARPAPRLGRPRPDRSGTAATGREIAVVGLAGRYPGARTVHEFWRNLAEGRDCVTEIPADRWDHGLYYDPDRNAPGRTYAKWGGFLDGVDLFDPLFFNIAPREAAFMDPQERLFLECVHETLEDAGYTRASLARYGGCGLPGNVGVFVGVMYEEYQLYGAQEQAGGNNITLSGSASTIANRVSYVYDLHGPSMALDTMCSSSLTALHLACQSLRTGDCEMAVAGGVNLSLHPNKYLMLASGKYASSRGRCESFGEGGDGYVPGEGVGAVLLKPLARAVEDGDTVYGVIRGTSVNHGGKTNGYAVPNPRAQHQVIGHALREAGVDAGSVSYVEAHGTGTSLGDPVEIAALTKAFRADTERTGYCAIGSVKSSIGHAESAAGIAALTKVLMQMKHRRLAPSLHADVLNPRIDFDNSPFRVQREAAPWHRPAAADGTETPRIAGISSFGAGGSNAHVVVEEFIPAEDPARRARPDDRPVAVVLSARTAEALLDQARRLLRWVTEEEGASAALADIAHTLQTGREEYEERLGLTAATTGELAAKIGSFLADGPSAPGLYRGRVERRGGSLAVFTADAAQERSLAGDIARGVYGELLRLWATGLLVDWTRLHRGPAPRRVPMPAYPFQGKRYWPALGAAGPRPAAGPALLHPLLHTNTSTLDEQCFTSRYTGEEFFLRDHRVRGERVLSGAACLELARAAAEASLTGHPVALTLENVVWARPIALRDGDGEKGEGLTVRVRLTPRGRDGIRFEILTRDTSPGATGETVHSEGTVRAGAAGSAVDPGAGDPGERVDVSRLRAECPEEGPEPDALYAAFARHGIAYGPGHRGIRGLWRGRGRALARLALPSGPSGAPDAYGLHPALLDSALQACAGLLPADGGPAAPLLPFAVDEVRVLGPCTAGMWAAVREREDPGGGVRRLDIDLCDEEGGVRVRLRGVSLRAPAAAPAPDPDAADTGALLARPCWIPAERRETGDPVPEGLVLVAGVPGLAAALRARDTARVVPLGPDSGSGSVPDDDLAAGYMDAALRVLAEVREVLAERAQHPVRVQLVAPAADPALRRGLLSLLRSAALENPRLLGQLVLVDPREPAERTASLVTAERTALADTAVRHLDGVREVLRWREEETTDVPAPVPYRDGGVYLITGGAGGLGAVFAGDAAARVRAPRIVLTGRSPLDPAKEELLERLRRLGADAVYERADIAVRDEAAALVRRIRERYGRIDGVLHGAGFIRDAFVLRKDAGEFARVLAPKVAGLVHLDEATREDDLGFLVAFSSVAGALGNVGQADYAAANAFMDAFAALRNTLVARGERRGRTLSVGWPLWADGGMHVDAATERSLQERFGLVPLDAGTGVRVLHQALAAGHDHVLVLAGYRPRLRRTLLAGLLAPDPAGGRASAPTGEKEAPEVSSASAADSGDGPDEGTAQRAVAYVTRLLSSAVDMPAGAIDPEASLEEYGVDSVMTMEMTRALEEVFGSLPKTLFFEHRTIAALAGHLLTAYPEQVRALLPASGVPWRSGPAPEPSVRPGPGHRFAMTAETRAPSLPGASSGTDGTEETGDIAVIGLAGRYPQARDVHEFWRNLAEGRDCVTEVPADRWDLGRHFDPEPGAPGKTYGRWGGFLEGAYDFDAGFFNVSPREAEIMDPQERLFLECVHETLEDAGYTRDTGRDRTGQTLDGRVGVFVGVMYEEYQLHGAQSQLGSAPLAVAGNPASVANRVSYFFNLRGPSMSVDTMCSSSLTAVHLACQSLRSGDCEAAVAGGVNLSLHPNKYLLLSQGRFLSTTGRCESFGAGGDGYVPGEGVGAVLLKPLAKAVADGDRIHGVIKGSAVNHGGKTNGYAVPDPLAQADAVGRALERAGVDARSVGYVEAHGTGTALGDPIEIAGLSRAFGAHTDDRGYCAIGSVKSGIGHAESAAGIAGITKVLLQLRHGRLAPSLHADVLNPHIDFAATPFTVQREAAEWPRPLPSEGSTGPAPRVAGVSSFGAGGANAHVVIAEYLPGDTAPRPAAEFTGTAVVPLSARTPQELRARAERLVEWLESTEHAPLALADIAYTLQVGREPMEERVGVLAASVPELTEELRRFAGGGPGNGRLVRGSAVREGGVPALLGSDSDLDAMIAAWAAKGKHEKLLDLWVHGVPVDWRLLYPGAPPRRIALPGYPFARERYFPFDGAAASRPVPIGAPAALHPLARVNTSDFTGQRFTSVLTGEEFFLRDHRVRGERVLPAAALLESAVAAACLAGRTAVEPSAPIALRDVVLARPFTVGAEPRELHTGLWPDEDGDIRFRLDGTPYGPDGDGDGGTVVHAAGVLCFAADAEKTVLDLPALREACDGPGLTGERCYELYRAAGIGYGPAHRAVRHILTGPGQALAELALPESVRATEDEFTLHPSLLDAAFQACAGLLGNGDGDGDGDGDGGDAESTATTGGGLPVPYAVEDVLVLDRCAAAMWAWIRSSAGEYGDPAAPRFDIDLADGHGRVRVRIGGLTFRALKGSPVDGAGHPAPALRRGAGETPDPRGLPGAEAAAGGDTAGNGHTADDGHATPTGTSDGTEAVLLRARWRERPATAAVPPGRGGPPPAVLLAGLPEAAAPLRAAGADVTLLVSPDPTPDGRYTALGVQLLEQLRPRVRATAGPGHVQLVVPGGPEEALLSGLAAMLRTAHLENPDLTGQLIVLDPADPPGRAVERILENRDHPGDTLVRYTGGRRQVRTWEADPAADPAAGPAALPWRDNGVYLVTGGAGALGAVFAREIAAQTAGAVLVLTGRSPLDAGRRRTLDALRAAGVRDVRYEQADITSRTRTEALVARILERYGRIDGVLHSAGITRDSFLRTKPEEDFRDVLAPKVAGVVNLDTATRGLPLDFFVTFSSTSGAHGNTGQADYAAANAFLDAYAWYRHGLAARGERSGQSQSVNWPLWAEGGMHIDAATERSLREHHGVAPLETGAGVRAFYRIIHSGHRQVMVSPAPPPRTPDRDRAPQPSPQQTPPVSSAVGTDS